jgi:hypothetical protein
MSSLDQVLDEAMTLHLEQREILVQILENRMTEDRRDQIAFNASISITEFEAGHFNVQTASEIMQELQNHLD